MKKLSQVVVVALALVACLLAPLAVWAQGSGRVDGRVLRDDGSGMGGVTVSVDGTSLVTLTDADGRFSIGGVPEGAHRLTFTAAEFTDGADVTVAAGSAVTLDKTVDWDISFAETITVFSASRQAERITEAPAAVTVVPQEEIEREAAHGQLPKLLEFTPGAEVTQSGIYDFNFNTRGFNSSLNRRVATMIDGRDPSVPFLGSQEWAAVSFPLDDIAQAELVRGPLGRALRRQRLSGVLNMITKRPEGLAGRPRCALTGGELDTFNADVRLAGQITDGELLQADRRPADERRLRRQSRNGPPSTRCPARCPRARHRLSAAGGRRRSIRSTTTRSTSAPAASTSTSATANTC